MKVLYPPLVKGKASMKSSIEVEKGTKDEWIGYNKP